MGFYNQMRALLTLCCVLLCASYCIAAIPTIWLFPSDNGLGYYDVIEFYNQAVFHAVFAASWDSVPISVLQAAEFVDFYIDLGGPADTVSVSTLGPSATSSVLLDSSLSNNNQWSTTFIRNGGRQNNPTDSGPISSPYRGVELYGHFDNPYGNIIYLTPSSVFRSYVSVSRMYARTRDAGGFNYDIGDWRASAFLAVAGGGGDPHITTMFGEKGDIGGFSGVLSLFSSDDFELRAMIRNQFFTEVGATVMIEGERFVFEARAENNEPVVLINGESVELGTVRENWKFVEFPSQDRTTSELGAFLESIVVIRTQGVKFRVEIGKLDFGRSKTFIFFNVVLGCSPHYFVDNNESSRDVKRIGLLQVESLNLQDPEKRTIHDDFLTQFAVDSLIE